MDYNNLFPNMYQPAIGGRYQPQFNQQYQAQQNFAQPQPQQNNGINWAQGEAGAKSFGVEPGKSALIMDSEQERFFIKTVDITGVPLPLRIFEYKEVTKPQEVPVQNNPAQPQQEYVTREEFEKLVSRIDALSANTKKQYPKKEKQS